MSAGTRPMYAKYYAVWKEHADRYGPRTAILYQVGGFYEIYDTENLTTGRTMANIREIAELCQLSLTVHAVPGSPEEQTLFGGVPDYALAKYEKILVNAGFTVVVVGQRKGPRGTVEERVVDHISSPGLYVDGTVAERRLVGVMLESLEGGAAALRRVYWAATALDLATGRIWFVEGADRDRLHQFLCMHPPAELVLWSDGGTAAASLTDSLRALCPAVHMRCLAPSQAAVEVAALDAFWAPAVKRLDWLGRAPQARRCLAALMEFARDHVPSALRALDEPEAWVPDGEVRLGNAALEQLGLLSLRGGNGSDADKQSLLGLMDQCRSVAGRRLMRSRLMRPISDIAVLRSRLAAITAAAAADGGPTAAPTERALRSLYDMSRLWRRLELGTADIGVMSCLLRSYESAAALMEVWPCASPPAGAREYLQSVAADWSINVATAMARDGVGIPVAALPFRGSAELTALFAEGRAIRQEAEDLCTAWSGLGRKEALYLDDAEGGGFRITGTKRRVTSVIAALRDEGDTTARQTPYKTTALVETAGLDALNARHRDWMKRWGPVWVPAWDSSVAALVTRGRVLHAAIEAWCAELDLAWTVARLAREWNWVHPEFVTRSTGDEAFVESEGVRHPLIERLTQTPYVSHSVSLGSAAATAASAEKPGVTPRGLLLYGMNASGKSSLMKALGLIVLLAQCGFPVPAKRLRLTPFTAIFTRILGNDNLWAGLSSFAVEMTEFREILRFADERSLVLGDELCSGTESLSATALVAAGVETLAARGTKFVFATHLHELAELPDIAGLSGVRAAHLKVHYDAAADRLVYDRSLAAGSGSALYGLEVCRALDLPVDYLDRAMALRKALAGWQAPTGSVYSAATVVAACAMCSASGSAARLETHHIQHQADGGGDEAANLVCLCAACHDDHHAGRLTIQGWEDTSAGRRLRWSRPAAAATAEGLTEEVTAWIREQRRLKVRPSVIQRMALQLFGCSLTEKAVRAVR